MKIDDIRQITASDLRVIVLALKVEEFNIDDERAKDDVYDRIKRLPSAEHINAIASNKGAIKCLQNAIGYILEVVDKYSSRDEEYKFRYKARTGLDPRYKILEYKRVIANREIKMKKEAAGLVKELVRVSSVADQKGFGKISGELVVCAKNLKDENYDQVSQLDLQKMASRLREAGLSEDADRLEKEAGFWDGVKGLGKSVGKGIADIATQQYQKARGTYQLGNLKGTFDRISKDIATALEFATKAQSQAVNPEKAQQIANMVNMLGNMQMMSQEVYRVIEEDAVVPAAPAAEAESLGAAPTPAAGGAPAPDAVPETSTLAPGSTVTWDSNGVPQSGVVKGQDTTDPSKTVVQIGNYPPRSLDTEGLRAACDKYRLSKQG